MMLLPDLNIIETITSDVASVIEFVQEQEPNIIAAEKDFKSLLKRIKNLEDAMNKQFPLKD